MSDPEEEFAIETREEVDLAQCPICFGAVFEDVLLDHQEWHQHQDNTQQHVDISISELWVQVRKGINPTQLREAITDAANRGKQTLIDTMRGL